MTKPRVLVYCYADYFVIPKTVYSEELSEDSLIFLQSHNVRNFLFDAVAWELDLEKSNTRK